MTDLFDFAEMPRLQTERLILREVRPSGDLDAMFALFGDPDVARFTDTGPFSDVDDAQEVIDWISRIFEQRRGLRWALALADNEEQMIGTCGYNHWDPSNNSGGIGYDLAKDHWGKGLMTEALQPVIRFGFERMGLNRIEADVTVGNDASARVLQKLGFTEEGLLRQRGFWKGRYHDLRMFGLLRGDWDRR